MKKIFLIIIILIPVFLFLGDKAYWLYHDYEEKVQEEQEKLELQAELELVEKEFYDSIYDDMIKDIRECGLSDLNTTYKFSKYEYSTDVDKYYVIPVNDYFSDNIKNYATIDEKVEVMEKCFTAVKKYDDKIYEFSNSSDSKIIVINLKSLAHFNITDFDGNTYKRDVSAGLPVYYINDELVSGKEVSSSKDYVGKETVSKNYSGCYPAKPHYVCTTVKGKDDKLYKLCKCQSVY